MPSYKQGQLVRCAGAFVDSALAAVDPTTVKVTIARPDGQHLTYTYVTDTAVVKDSVGNYHIDVNGSIPGTWVYWWHSEGTGQAADEKTFIIEGAVGHDTAPRPRSLGVDFVQIQRYVGRLLGISRNPGTWQANERADVGDIIRSGLRRFYWPPAISSGPNKPPQSWSWSFLKIRSTIDFVAGTTSYALPDDFGELIDGGFTFTTDQQSIAIVQEEQIRQLQSQAAQSGAPKYAAIRVSSDETTKYEAVFYPTPDAVYTVSFRYSVTPGDLTETSPIPLGGPVHGETILEACLSAAEKTLNDAEEVHEKKFMECLARSIAADQNLTGSTSDSVWPLEDPAKGLGINKAYLKRLIGRQMGLGAHSAIWNHKEASEVDLALQTGLRKFYAPCVLPNEKNSHEWSFLSPVGRIVTNDEVYNYDLPDGYVMMSGPLTFAPDSGTIYPPVQMVLEHQIRLQYQRTTAAGRPTMAAQRVKPLNAGTGTRHELIVWPQPDDEYELSFRYQVNPDDLPEEACLPYGGQQHAQTIIEACLAAAEEVGGKVNGPHAVKFLECLQASVSVDRRLAPETLGYNRDNSDRPSHFGEPYGTWHDCDANLVTYNGNLY